MGKHSGRCMILMMNAYRFSNVWWYCTDIFDYLRFANFLSHSLDLLRLFSRMVKLQLQQWKFFMRRTNLVVGCCEVFSVIHEVHSKVRNVKLTRSSYLVYHI